VHEWGMAAALWLLLEGLMPFLLPAAWREAAHALLRLKDGQLRFIGLVLLLAGAILLYWLRQS
jgi:uncharacterized protein